MTLGLVLLTAACSAASTNGPTITAAELAGVACSSVTSCVAVGANYPNAYGVVVPIRDGRAGAAKVLAPGASQSIQVEVDELNAVACPASTTCEAVGRGEAVGLGAQSQDSAVVLPVVGGVAGDGISAPGVGQASGPNELVGVACPTVSMCEAVGSQDTAPGTEGAMVPILGGVPALPELVSGASQLSAIACASTTLCEAVGAARSGAPVVVSFRGGAPAAPKVVPGVASLKALACASAETCVAIGVNLSDQSIELPFTDGVPGPPSVTSTTTPSDDSP